MSGDEIVSEWKEVNVLRFLAFNWLYILLEDTTTKRICVLILLLDFHKLRADVLHLSLFVLTDTMGIRNAMHIFAMLKTNFLEISFSHQNFEVFPCHIVLIYYFKYKDSKSFNLPSCVSLLNKANKI